MFEFPFNYKLVIFIFEERTVGHYQIITLGWQQQSIHSLFSTSTIDSSSRIEIETISSIPCHESFSINRRMSGRVLTIFLKFEDSFTLIQ